jgi:hypothetical protein
MLLGVVVWWEVEVVEEGDWLLGGQSRAPSRVANLPVKVFVFRRH